MRKICNETNDTETSLRSQREKKIKEQCKVGSRKKEA